MSDIKPPASIAFTRYVELLDALLLERAVHGTLHEDVEERFVIAMNDCRRSMTPDEGRRHKHALLLKEDGQAVHQSVPVHEAANGMVLGPVANDCSKT